MTVSKSWPVTAVVHSTYAGTNSPRLTGLLRKPCRPSQGRQETRRHPMIPHHLQSHMALPQLLSELLLLHLVSSDIIQFAHAWLIFGHPLVFKTSVVSYTLCLWRNLFHLRHLFHVWERVSLQWPPLSFTLHVDNLCPLFYSWWTWPEVCWLLFLKNKKKNSLWFYLFFFLLFFLNLYFFYFLPDFYYNFLPSAEFRFCLFFFF